MNITQVFRTVKYNNVTKLRQFLSRSDDKVSILVSKNDMGDTLLHLACFLGRYKIVRLLLEEYVEIFLNFPILLNMQNNANETALFIASKKGYYYIIQLISKFYYDGILDLDLCDNAGVPAVYVSWSWRHYAITRYLLRLGARSDIGSSRISDSFLSTATISRDGERPLPLVSLRRDRERPLPLGSLRHDEDISLLSSGPVRRNEEIPSSLELRYNVSISQFNNIREQTFEYVREYLTDNDSISPTPLLRGFEKLPKHFQDDVMDNLIIAKKQCAVCWDFLKRETIMYTDCFHYFCNDCIRKCSVCPLCRVKI